MPPAFPNPADLTVCFAHSAYRLADELRSRGKVPPHFEVRSLDELKARIGEADVLVVSGFWRNEMAKDAPKLKFIQSISAGTDQYDRKVLAEHGIRLASAQGANQRAVAEHAMALILALTRQLHLARDNQAKRAWRGMIGDPAEREKEIGGSTLVIYGLGGIGSRLATLARAFGMRVVGVRRSPRTPSDPADDLVPPERFTEALSTADFVALTCPLTPETEGLMGETEFAAMKSSAYLINVARGRVVQEEALLDALRERRIAGAGLDCFHEEPLPPDSPIWTFENVLVTPHSAGETQRYEANIIDLLLENLDRLSRGEMALRNQIV
jgi:D-2-hydroxyacid dehydrogenase (NADP+)